MASHSCICSVLFLVLVFPIGCNGEGTKNIDCTDYLSYQTKNCLMKSVCDGWSTDTCLEKAASEDAFIFSSGKYCEQENEVARCIANARDCDDYWKCTRDTDFTVCDDSFVDFCDGEVLVRCIRLHDDRRVVSRTDCRDFDNKCLSTELGPMCAYDYCPQGEGCDGDLLLYCTNDDPSVSFALDCGELGKECVDTQSGSYCVDNGPTPCSEKACAGSVIQECYEGLLASWDCTIIDPEFVCFADEYNVLRCGMPEGNWECETHGDGWCEGSVAKTCINGKIVSVDCSSFTSAVCTESADGIDHTSSRCETH